MPAKGAAAWAAFLIPLVVYAATISMASTDGVDGSIVAAQYAHWSSGSYSIGVPPNLPVKTVDYGVFNGRAYSAVAPGMAILSYPFAAVSFLAGAGSGGDFSRAYLADEAFLAVVSSAAVYLTYRIARLFGDEKASLLIALATAFGTPLWPVTTVVFPNAPALALTLGSVYLVLLLARNPTDWGLAAAGGALLGVASFVEYAAALSVFPLGYYIFRRVGTKKRLFPFVGAFMAGSSLNLVYNYLLFGNPLLFPEQLKSGSQLPIVGLLSSFQPQLALLHAASYLGSPYRGIAVLCPVLVVGLFAIARSHRYRLMRAEALLFLSLFLIDLAFYSSWRDWTGGLGYGPRFLVIGAPFLLIPAVGLVERGRSSLAGWAFFSIAAYSVFVQGAGALTSAFSVAGGPETFQLPALNLGWLLSGKLDSWWIQGQGLQYTSVAMIFAAILLASIWLMLFALSRDGSAKRGVKQLIMRER